MSEPVKKYKIMTLSDHPLMPSGVSHMMRNIINSLIATGRYQVLSLGAFPVKNEADFPQPHKVNDDWVILPVKEFADMNAIRHYAQGEKIDAILMMSDPRFYGKLLISDNEIRANVPIVYYGIWDNGPKPLFNKRIWESVDVLTACSRLTYNLAKDLELCTELHYMPHCIDQELFRKLPSAEVNEFKNKFMSNIKDKFIFFWNNKNGRRKHPSTLLYVFKEFLDIVGHDKAFLLMNSHPGDPDGFDLERVKTDFGLEKSVGFNIQKVDEKTLSLMYNSVDCVLNIADAEGFGLSNSEALACEIPVIANLTGGIVEQITDGINTFGIGLTPVSRYIIGTPAINDIMAVPYIFEDRFANKDLLDAMLKMYNMTKQERNNLGKLGRRHLENNFSMSMWNKFWPELFDDVVSRYGSWPNKLHKPYEIIEL